LLMHPDGAEDTVIDDNEDHRSIELHRGGKLLPKHHEATVTAETHHGARRLGQLGADGGGDAVAHRPAGRRKLGAEFLVLEETVHPDGVIARPRGNYGVLGQRFVEPGDDLAKIDRPRHFRWLDAGEIILPRTRNPRGAA